MYNETTQKEVKQYVSESMKSWSRGQDSNYDSLEQEATTLPLLPLTKMLLSGWKPWSSDYKERLIIKRSWVRILAQLYYFKRLKINKKGRKVHIKKVRVIKGGGWWSRAYEFKLHCFKRLKINKKRQGWRIKKLIST